MKPKKPLATLVAWLSLLGTSADADAAAAASVSAAADKEAVVLSPFTVTTDKDVGFAATSSLAGGRLATDLRDTPAAYSVMTREFIDALDITDLDKAAEWITGNGGAIIDNGEGMFFANPGAYSTRGFAATGGTNGASKPMRNFFKSFISSDSYAVERFEFGRGPNSVLFGNGTLGGIPTATTKQARPDKSFRTLKATVASFANYRGELDVNQSLLNQKAALRAAVVWQDAEGWRDRDFDERRGLYLAGTLRPFKNTEIKVYGESYTIAEQRSYTNIMDRLSGWDGITTFNTPQPLATLPTDANARGIGRWGAGYYVYNPLNPNQPIFNYANDATTLSGGATNTTPAGDFVQGSAAGFGIQNTPFLYQINAPPGYYDRAIRGSAFRMIDKEFSAAFDAPLLTRRFRDVAVIINHRLQFERLGDFHFEFGGNTNKSKFRGNGMPQRNLNNTYIDLNRVLPNGAPNPNFLFPYNDAQVIHNDFTFEYRTLRGAAAWVLKPNRIGKFTFNVMGGLEKAERDQDYRYLSLAQGDDHRQWGRLSGPALQNLNVRYYWNNSSRPLADRIAGQSISFVDPVAGTTTTLTPRFVRDTSRQDTQQIDIQDYEYGIAAMNAKFLKDRLVVLGAIRHDSYTNTVKRTMAPGDYPRDWDGTTRFLRPDAPADWATLTYTPKNAAGQPISAPVSAANRPRVAATNDRDPLYVNDRFQDDFNLPETGGSQVTHSYGSVLHLLPWFSPFYNFAETYNPADGSAILITGAPRKPTVAEGKDYGVRMEFFKGRLNLSYTRYESEEDNSVEGSQPPDFNTIYDANVIGDQTAFGRNNRGVANLPLVWRDNRTRIAEGEELEMTLNVSRNLRLTANYSKPQVGSGNRYLDTLAYIDRNLPILKQIVQDAGGLVDANNLATVDNSVPINNRSPDVQAAVNRFNEIVNFQRTWTGASDVIGDSPESGNFFADYTFHEGWLKRLRIGAGLNWRGERAVGNRGGDTIANPNYNPALPVSGTNPLAIDDPDRNANLLVWAPARKTVTATFAYSWKWRNRDFQANLVINNLLNDQSIIYSGTALRPKGGDYSSPAREAVPGGGSLSFTTPINYRLSLTVKL